MEHQIALAHPTSGSPAGAEEKDFCQILQAELIARINRNPRYSLRKFAIHLGVDHSRLSKILRKERPLSPGLVRAFGERLNLDAASIVKFENRHASLRKTPQRGRVKSTKTFLPIPLDSFALIQDWRHYAFLELMKLADFQPDLSWVSRKLSVSIPEARAYQERLERVGLLEILPCGKWTDKTEGFSTHMVSHEFTSYAHKGSQRKTLQLAQQALDQIPMQRRDQSSTMMATNMKKMAMAKVLIQKFRHSLCEFLEDCEQKDTLLQLSVSLFPLLEITPDGVTGHED